MAAPEILGGFDVPPELTAFDFSAKHHLNGDGLFAIDVRLTADGPREELVPLVRRFRAHVVRRIPPRMLLAEADICEDAVLPRVTARFVFRELNPPPFPAGVAA